MNVLACEHCIVFFWGGYQEVDQHEYALVQSTLEEVAPATDGNQQNKERV